jgi:polyisoprenoid-binding protein YceI
MKKLILIAGSVIFCYSSALAQSWSLDKSHAKLGFSITHMTISDVDGSFKNFDVKVNSANPDFSDASVELTADINSINTDNDGRDKHLKGEDYFNAEKFPTLNFKSTSLKKVKGNTYALAGNLTMHGVTKPVVLSVTFNGTTQNPMSKKTVAGFKIGGKIKRSAFAIAPSTPSAMLGDDVTLNANIELTKD